MRKELELMETIEKYLKGNLTEQEKIAFESKIKESPDLKKEVELQKQILKGIERTGLKQSAKKGFKKYKLNKGLKNWGLTGFAVAVIALGSVFVYNSIIKNNHKENAAYDLPELNEQGEKLWSDADKYLAPQMFELNADQDTVVETADGIVIAIPANSFLNANGQPAKGKIQLEVKEALNAADIMKAGLNTKSGDKLLETGGMFYINARQGEASLKIDSKNPLYAEIPTNEVKPNMQLFEGKRLPNGTIDWVNPKPIVKDLIPVDILSLNFYPPNYLDSLKSWGYNTKDKKFTDSLYYSFAASRGFYLSDTINEFLGDGFNLFYKNCAACHSPGKDRISAPGLGGVTKRVPGDDWLKKFIRNNQKLIATGDPYANKIYKENNKAPMTVFEYFSEEEISKIIKYLKLNDGTYPFSSEHGINPAKIKAVWDEKFQNTLLATREFEERMPYIHRTCDEQVLDMYINNLDKNLSTIDSMVAQGDKNYRNSEAASFPGYPEFLKFAARGDGKVKNGNICVRLLKAYYEQKSKIYTEAISKTVNEFWDKQDKKTQEATEKRNEQNQKEEKRISDNFEKELDVNMTEAYRQIGKPKPKRNPDGTYGTYITTTGWKNLDAFVIESTRDRETLNYTDPQSGKKAIIKYEPLTVAIRDYKNYDRVLVYLLPDELNSFMRIENKNDLFEEKLNELMIYKLICIGYKGEESFYFSQDNVKPGSLSIALIKTTNAEIQNNVNKLNKRSQSKAMNDELNYMAFEKQEKKRQAELVKITELTNKICPVIFPCSNYPSDSVKRERQ
jgi:hypothetical protein